MAQVMDVKILYPGPCASGREGFLYILALVSNFGSRGGYPIGVEPKWSLLLSIRVFSSPFEPIYVEVGVSELLI